MPAEPALSTSIWAYTINLFRDPIAGDWFATVPALGCGAFGSTPEIALRECGIVLQKTQGLMPRVQPAVWPEDAGDG